MACTVYREQVFVLLPEERFQASNLARRTCKHDSAALSKVVAHLFKCAVQVTLDVF